jgi:arginyl-tRNA--protein-N-Asp/Glu arginylyltransferase
MDIVRYHENNVANFTLQDSFEVIDHEAKDGVQWNSFKRLDQSLKTPILETILNVVQPRINLSALSMTFLEK